MVSARRFPLQSQYLLQCGVATTIWKMLVLVFDFFSLTVCDALATCGQMLEYIWFFIGL